LIENIRNFSIIAHIDHGKSTLADRLLEYTHTVTKREMREQVLDAMDLERERGITIKAKAIRLNYASGDGKTYQFNLIDTPGHVDFSYEVSRSLSACEGCILVVDAVQGVEAQTLSNVYLAGENKLKIIPVINKIDLPNAHIADVRKQITEILAGEEDILEVSAKQGTGTMDVLEAVARRIPCPLGAVEKPLFGLIFDSMFDPYRGALIYVRMFDGRVVPGMKIRMVSSGREYEVTEAGIFHLKMKTCPALEAGEVGYIAAGIKNIHDIKIGDTVTDSVKPTEKFFSGFREVKPYVFCSMYTKDNNEYDKLKKSLEKFRLNDASFDYKPENSEVLGFGFRCGFLGLLHMDIVKERLRREYGLNLLITAPNVVYRIVFRDEDGKEVFINNPSEFPDTGKIKEVAEPYVNATIILPGEYIGRVMKLLETRRAKFSSLKYINPTRAVLVYELPLAEMILDFYDRLKSVSQGYASFDYKHTGYSASDMVKMEILVNHQPVDALARIMERSQAYYRAEKIVERLKEVIPRQMFSVPIQARVDNRIIARENLKAFRKDVTAKLYGGDVTRKNKLLDKQKAGKKKMEKLGKLDIPQEAFFSILRIDE